MEFYTYAYVVQRGEFTSLLQYIMTSILLVALLVVGVKVMYNRFDTKFRDLGIIIVLGLVFLLGLQVNDYTRDINSAEESSYMVQFLNNLSERADVPKDKIRVNTLRVQDRMIVNIEEAYFEVTFTMNKDGYSLRPVEMINSNPKVVDVKKDGR
ncbi:MULTISPECIES: DUF3290 family protein [unclassified Veillonella]|jgi:hypothetical protein|uniref:DUF3290 family protein n=1 Tax=unclassified Veillonella TaxID=2630086 RepID=UPI00021A39CC|nr:MULTISPECIES: DUF3290 family protein [unclassified Veillonella]EGS38425.1 hypothetical protein HMPREF9200_0891 [Veillonella sp. oral taxon 780 str. F0422]